MIDVHENTESLVMAELEQLFKLKAEISLLQWIALHPGAREIGDEAPGWLVHFESPEDIGAFMYRITVRHRDGRTHTFSYDLYASPVTKEHPWNRNVHWMATNELHQMYPDEVKAYSVSEWEREQMKDWDESHYISYAVDALLSGDTTKIDRALKDVARAYGANLPPEHDDGSHTKSA